jgi:nicotinamidase-related amidase
MGNPEAEALIVVDVQCGLLTGPGAIPDAPDVLAAVDRLVQSARDSRALIVHVQNDGPDRAAAEPGTPGWALAIEPLATEPVIRKREDDAFAGTGLEMLLRDHGAASVVICGVQSEMCVAATARAAMQHDLVVVLPRDAHGTYPIPADTGGGVAVPAAQVARVAEWSLGDALVVTRSSTQVAFKQGPRSQSDRPQQAQL